MTLDEIASLSVQPVPGPAGPRILGLLAVAAVGAMAWVFRGAAHAWSLISQPPPQPIPVEVPRRRVPSRREV
jgi:hypothetical protein